VTDIDALALIPSNFGELSLLIGDCKTLKNQSPISRALWLNGLMNLIKAKKGIVLLTKEAENDHKLLASKLDVSIFSDKDFDFYQFKTRVNNDDSISALCDGENWDKYYDIQKRFSSLSPAFNFIKNDFWNIEESPFKLRKTLSVIRDIRRELNPNHSLQVALAADLISLFSITFNYVIRKVFNQSLLFDTKENLSNELKLLIWGGGEQYQHFNLLYKAASSKGEEAEIALPEWDMFVQLIRQGLETPFATAHVPLIMKEVAFEYIDPTKSDQYNLAVTLAKENPQAAKLAIMITEYICKACKLPAEFEDIINTRIIKIQS
ncbi:hypothetical protein, partial [Priestia megaterium]|uniref:hypothetical protein n=1 Tax=Priestia megaterium TaxID=1404 RepID=UPI0016499EEA